MQEVSVREVPCLHWLTWLLLAVANSHLKLTLSLNANITFLRSAHEGYVYAEATETFSHARVPFIEVRITDDEGQLVAIFTSSGYRKNEELPVETLK